MLGFLKRVPWGSLGFLFGFFWRGSLAFLGVARGCSTFLGLPFQDARLGSQPKHRANSNPRAWLCRLWTSCCACSRSLAGAPTPGQLRPKPCAGGGGGGVGRKITIKRMWCRILAIPTVVKLLKKKKKKRGVHFIV